MRRGNMLLKGVGWMLLLASGLLCSASIAAGAPLVSPGAGLPGGAACLHPDPDLALAAGNLFNVFTAGSMPLEWTLVESHVGVPGMGTMDVTVYSQAWRHTDGHLLFAYCIENQSTAPVRKGNIAGYDPLLFAIVDCGVLDFGGDLAFDQGDPLFLWRPSGGAAPQLAFAFEAPDAQGQNVERLLAPGQTSAWFYAETDAAAYTLGLSTVIDGGQSADMMEVLVPAPEPATLVLLACGCAGLAARRARKR